MSLWKYKYFLDVEFYKSRSEKLCDADGSEPADRVS